MASLGWAEVIHVEDVDRTRAWAHSVETAEPYAASIEFADSTDLRWFRRLCNARA